MNKSTLISTVEGKHQHQSKIQRKKIHHFEKWDMKLNNNTRMSHFVLILVLWWIDLKIGKFCFRNCFHCANRLLPILLIGFQDPHETNKFMFLLWIYKKRHRRNISSTFVVPFATADSIKSKTWHLQRLSHAAFCCCVEPLLQQHPGKLM